MTKKDPFSGIRKLIGDVGFKDMDDLGSFCLAVGLFHEEPTSDPVDPPRRWDPSNYPIWDLVQIISYTRDPTIEDIKGMKRFLYPYLVSGIKVVENKIEGKSGSDMLENLSDLIPP